jgi:hypothetical protein
MCLDPQQPPTPETEETFRESGLLYDFDEEDRDDAPVYPRTHWPDLLPEE